jgi:hypothetical protein
MLIAIAAAFAAGGALGPFQVDAALPLTAENIGHANALNDRSGTGYSGVPSTRS